MLEHTVLIRERSFYINVERSLSLFHPTHPSWPYTGQKQLHSLHSYIHYPTEMMDPFKSHLVALLSIYELGPFPGTPIPRYEGPTDWQTESILKSFGEMARRMCSAEETVGDLRKQLVNTFLHYLHIHSNYIFFQER